MSAGLSAGAVFLYMKLPSLISNAVINLTVEMIPEAPIKGLPIGGDDGIKFDPRCKRLSIRKVITKQGTTICETLPVSLTTHVL